MTGFFNSRSGSTVKNYHYYAPSDVKLHDIGLASYTRNSLEKFGKRKKNGQEEDDPDISEYLSGGIDTIKPTLLGDNATDLIIYRFDKENKRYLYTTSSGSDEDNIYWTPSGGVVFKSLKTFQEQFDLYQKGWVKDESEVFNIKYIWSKINNSLSGCITFHIQNYSILNSSSSGIVRLYFQSRGDGSQRGVAFQPPIIAGVGRTATGQEHAFNISESLPIGSLSRPDVGGITNPNNTVAGPMKLHFNRGTGEWESGTTQVYFQLLDDIDGVPQKELPTDIDSVDNDSLKIPFTSGRAIVMETEKGNPHLFTASSFGCDTSSKRTEILVNRTPRSYTRGELVLGSNINGDWALIPLINGSSVAKKFTVEWSQIQKYIVNANSFFRNMENNKFVRSHEGVGDNDNILVGSYSLYLRNKFYDGLKSSPKQSSADVAQLNIDNEFINMKNIVPSTGYLQFYDADLIRTTLGGNSDRDYLIRTNVSSTPADDQDYGLPYAYNTPFNWGLFFQKGYTSTSVRQFREKDNIAMSAIGEAYTSGNLSINPKELPSPAFDLSDVNLTHMPAQIALNSKNNPTLNMKTLWNLQNKTGMDFVNDLISYVCGSGGGADPTYKSSSSYLWNSEKKNIYGLVPNSSSSVQFSPLQLELALSDLLLPPGEQPRYFQNGYLSLRTQLETGFLPFGITNYTTSNILSKFWTRNNLKDRKDLGGNVKSRIGLSSDKLLNVTNGKIETPPDRPPRGGPNLIPPADGAKERSNTVGIIAAKATFNLSNGGTLILDTNSFFGLTSYSIGQGGGGDFASTIIGGIMSFVQDLTGKRTESAIKQWGANEENDERSFGTTVLFCEVYDHCPNTVLDGRFFVPIQMNPNDDSVDFEEPDLANNTPVSKGTIVKKVKNTCRRGMLLTDGGFTYFQKKIAMNISSLDVESAGNGYKNGNIIIFGGEEPAKIKLIKDGPLTNNPADYEIVSSGNFTPSTFLREGLLGVITKGESEGVGTGGKIYLNGGKIVQEKKNDNLKFYGRQTLTPSSNNGSGDGKGEVFSSKNKTFSLEKNATGKYDIFFFFVNDILHTLVGFDSVGNQSMTNYVKLDISSSS